MKNYTKSILILAIICFISQICLFAQKWEQMDGPEGGTVRSITSLNDILYASTGNFKLYKSTNDGINWEKVQSNQGVSLLYSHNKYLFSGGIFRSSDEGKTWLNKSNGITLSDSPNSFVSIGNILFVNYLSVLYKSTDDGENWSKVFVDSLLIKRTDLLIHKSFLRLSNNNLFLFVVTDRDQDVFPNIYKSTNLGET